MSVKGKKGDKEQRKQVQRVRDQSGQQRRPGLKRSNNGLTRQVGDTGVLFELAQESAGYSGEVWIEEERRRREPELGKPCVGWNALRWGVRETSLSLIPRELRSTSDTKVVHAAGKEAGLRYARASQSCRLPWGARVGLTPGGGTPIRPKAVLWRRHFLRVLAAKLQGGWRMGSPAE